EIELAMGLRPKKVTDFKDASEVRRHLIDVFKESRRTKQMGVITDFQQQDFEFEGTFTRLSGGSLGGKGRGLAFLATLLTQCGMEERIHRCRVRVPDTLVVGTEAFDTFMIENDLHRFLGNNMEDEEIAARFLDAALPEWLMDALKIYLAHVRYPLAVRSSSLLEDSQNQPFAGIYATYLLPNNCEDEHERLSQLCQAIKLVYASAYMKKARAYIQSALRITEEEKMALVIQRLIGNAHGDRFYPVCSGVAQSYHFYPVPPLEREDGLTSIALGLGKIVVEGGEVLSFSPLHHRVIPGFYTPQDVLRNSQKVFYALDLTKRYFDLREGEDATLVRLDISEADEEILHYLASTYDANDNRIRNGTAFPGPKVITFAGILRYEMMPLVRILEELLEIGQKSMGRHVEIEFACAMGKDDVPEFHVLQVRPLVTLKEHREVTVGAEDVSDALIYSHRALGNGALEGVRDVVFVPPERFDPSKTMEMSKEIGQINKALSGTSYIVIGPGRWGTNDRFLGIPVEWDQISWARVMVEYSTEHHRIDPSQGTHFFHNITSLGIKYFTVPYGSEARISWEALRSAELVTQGRYVSHVRFPEPLLVKVDGRSGKGVVLGQMAHVDRHVSNDRQAHRPRD
ncbi:MAG: PEP/pyruvate-binding domain-containing protein, partial [Candidatus Thermoplasmatota archaeon]